MITIQTASSNNYEQLAEIWFKASIIAHNFIAQSYWQQNILAMQTQYLPNAEVYVAIANKQPVGFIALKNNCLVAIFIDPNFQGKGIGTQLLHYAKQLKSELTLQVYQKNKQAVQFYLQQGFIIVNETVDETTQQLEYVLRWNAPS
ncbi:GNAT family N-acetyltransferase [Flavobacterium agricola]|uniref:GNAT family N-acetyltransferase n=1 Tax=Flavobacterium agricola TaxID=2870839 RepID=A0ABY6M027_9FLAO|nr:GNAT family N-acetyltransferase [Flavobacterium agricola]UYW01908.1 GNAT family N-acetyltransferase [Flavobacterium agricola]